MNARSALISGAKAVLELSKAHLSLYIALSAVAGHVLARDHLSIDSLLLGGWVFMLAAGAGVLNNIQDRKYDRNFLRTRNRVLAKQVFSLKKAWIMALTLLGAAGTGLYSFYPSAWPVLLGTAAVICYNGLYTPMKKSSRWAMVPGIVCGMIPPVLGWFAVSGYWRSNDISGLVILATCLGSWQIPHYLLVSLKQGVCQRTWPGRGMHYHVLIWTSLFSLGMTLFLIRGWVVNQWLIIPAFILAVVLSPVIALMLFYPGIQGRNVLAGKAFLAMNLSMFLFLSIMIVDRL